MKYLIVQDWQSTHGNHAGMKHMCDLLVAKYPDEYKVFVKECPRTWKSPRTFMEKICWRLYGKYAKEHYLTKTYPLEYLELCSPMFSNLKAGDEVFLLEYMLPWASQYELACYIRENYPNVKIYALSHLTGKYFDEMTAKEPDLIQKWAKPVDKLLTLGSSLSSYFEKAGISKEKISTGFHYVDSDYYQKQQPMKSNSPLKVIMMGALQRDYGMLAEVVKQCPDVHWIICRGRKNVDDLFPKTPNVELKGFLEEDELRHQMDIADVSLNVMEDTVGSNVITTSMAMGLAMVVSDVGSIRDYCNDENALFCQNNVEQFVRSIKKLQNNLQLVLRMKKASLENSKRLQIDNINRWFFKLK
nr:glycosyltransferase [Prevotella sp.]